MSDVIKKEELANNNHEVRGWGETRWQDEYGQPPPVPIPDTQENRFLLDYFNMANPHDQSGYVMELNRRLKNVEEFLKMEFGDKYNK